MFCCIAAGLQGFSLQVRFLDLVRCAIWGRAYVKLRCSAVGAVVFVTLFTVVVIVCAQAGAHAVTEGKGAVQFWLSVQGKLLWVMWRFAYRFDKL